MINKIRPECKIISAPAPREYSKNYINLIGKVKLWKKHGVKTFCFIIDLILDTSGVIMVSENHQSCEHFNLETGDGLCRFYKTRVPRDFQDTFSNFFQAIRKLYEKNTTLLNR